MNFYCQLYSVHICSSIVLYIHYFIFAKAPQLTLLHVSAVRFFSTLFQLSQDLNQSSAKVNNNLSSLSLRIKGYKVQISVIQCNE